MSSVSAINFTYYFTKDDFLIGVIMNLNRAFALRLSNILVERKMSKYRLEKETGITHSALRYIFNEVNVDVKFSTIVKVCTALDMTLTEFFDDELFILDNLDVE